METRFIFFVCFIASVLVLISGVNVNCIVNFSSYICKHISNIANFPIVLPANIRKVTLFGTDFLNRSLLNGLFRSPTWTNISELSILEFNVIVSIEKDFLDGLDNLKFLSISSCLGLKDIHPDVFNSTPDLEALYLDDNPYLKLPVVEEALNGRLDKLKYLSLIGIQAFGRRVILGENFSKALCTKNLTYLDISGVKTIMLQHRDVQNVFPNVKYLNISYSLLMAGDGLQNLGDSYFRNIEFLDLTSCTSLSHYTIKLEDFNISWVLFENIRYVFAQHIMIPDIGVRLNARYTFEKAVLQDLKVLDLSQNNIMVLNITFSGTYDFHALETMNLSSNNLEYISPSLLSSFPSLKILDLSRNQLHKMQNMDDFSYLFCRNKDLEIIYLHKNNLSFVPSNIFSTNTKLRAIDLSDNKLVFFNIDLKNVFNLTLIDLRKNRLKSLPAAFLGQLERTFLHQDSATKKRNLYDKYCAQSHSG
ncbi:hypothetical protein ACJMK2_000944 [Sinanodonta woodiana]|uniref:Uncharacterized protein n=1 Tax=Sinanodonta woodiana TaxID=1069815 RepID=A0ABD3XQS8_SINWO